jgi:UDPglucose--hexose-1-phosphate uridylyltransferase
MEFVCISKLSRYLDPMNGFTPVDARSEIRYDPLTGHSTRILNFPVRRVERPDLTEIIEKSKAICPFCPELVELVTPKFHPDLISTERFIRGGSICFPNAFPNDENAAVTVMSKTHYVPVAGFDEVILADSIKCCIDYLEEITLKQPSAVYQSINWNYMPLAGGSIIHPHLQVSASSTPTNYYSSIEPVLSAYPGDNGNLFWEALIEKEKKEGQRFITESENMSWVVAFAPMGIFDVIGVIKHCTRASDLTGDVLSEMLAGILRVLAYIDSLNMHSLNMSLYFRLESDIFTPHIRICPRVSIPPFGTSQINYMRMLHNEPMTTVRPESVCEAMKSIW